MPIGKIASFFDSRRILFAVIVSAVVYYASFLSRGLWLIKDSATYFLLGRSLAQGAGYIDPLALPSRLHALFPPGYPFILSVVMRFFGENVLFLRIASVLTTGVSLLLLPRLLRKDLTPKETLVTVALFAFSPVLLDFAHTLTSETAYILFSWLALYFFTRKDSLPGTLLASCTAIGAFYIRSIGIALCVALVVYLLIKRKYARSFLVILLMLVTMLPWLVCVFSKSDTYLQTIMHKDYYDAWQGTMQFVDIPLRILSNLKYYTGKVVGDFLFFPFLMEATFGNPLFLFKIALSALFSFLFLKGYVGFLRKGIRIVELYIALYCGVFLVHSFHSERFLLPIYPFLLTYALTGIDSPAWRPWKIPVILVLATSALLGNLFIAGDAFRYKPLHNPYEEAFLWVRGNTPPKAVIMITASDAVAARLYAQRNTVVWDVNFREIPLFIRLIQEKKVGYLIAERNQSVNVRAQKRPGLPEAIKLIMEYSPGYLVPVYQSSAYPALLVYKVKEG